MTFRITNEWLINLSEDFENRLEEDQLIFWKTGVTVVVAAYRLPEDISKLELLNQIQEKIPDDALEKLVSTKGKIAGLGYTQIQRRAGEKNRLALYTFTTSDTSCLQTAFYLDNPAELDWAKSIWENISYLPNSQDQPLSD